MISLCYSNFIIRRQPGIRLWTCLCSRKVCHEERDRQTHNHLTALCPGLPGWVSTRRNIHSHTPILFIRHTLSTSSIYCNAQHPPRSIYVLDSPFQQPFPRLSLVYLLVWNLQLHVPYISSPNHYLLFTTLCLHHCNFFAIVPRICHGQREMKQNTSTSLRPAVVSSNTVSGISYKWTLPQRSPQTSNGCHGDGCCHGDNCCGDGCCGDDMHHVMAVTQRCFNVGNSRWQQTCSL